MKFGPSPPEEAVGCILAHKTKLPDRMLKKGHLLSAEDCRLLAEQDHQQIIVARLEPGDINEDQAAARLGNSASGVGVSPDTAFTGRSNLYADVNGVLVVDPEAIAAANRIDPAITFATLPNFSRVAAHRMVATAKVISFAVPEALVEKAGKALRGAVRVAEFSPRKIGLVATQLPHLKSVTMDKTRRVLEDRLKPSGSQIVGELRVPHTEEAVSEAIRDLLDMGADFLILFGASAVVDRYDVLPAALEQAGGTVDQFGMPVDPGNLLMLGNLTGVPVLGAPGCARSPKENGFDWVLDRILAGLTVTPEDVTAMGVGGLLMEIGTRPQPREKKQQSRTPRIAAIVLAAGKSSRMGGPNKLLAQLDGKTLIRHASEAAIGAELAQTIVVTGHLHDKVGGSVNDLDIKIVHNPDYAEGMAGSIRTGVDALADDIDAALILLGDMPRITSRDLRKLVEAYLRDETCLIASATSHGKRGNPVLWDKRFFADLKSLSGDIGARHLIATNPGFVSEVEIGDAARLDLDTPQALHDAGGTLPDRDS